MGTLITLTITQQDFELLCEALGDLPAKRSFNLLLTLGKQLQLSKDEARRQAAEAPAPEKPA